MSSSPAIVDFNGDDNLDIVSNYDFVGILLGSRTGTYQERCPRRRLILGVPEGQGDPIGR
jgi:hypothetical protein